jgi:hypothetical protein
MGEVVPRELGSEETELAANRRVEFHIIRTLDPLEVPPEYSNTIQLPWNGETQQVNTPTEQQSTMGVEQKPVEKFDVEQFKNQLDAEDSETKPPPDPATEPAPAPDAGGSKAERVGSGSGSGTP